jgi:hypothetical protein
MEIFARGDRLVNKLHELRSRKDISTKTLLRLSISLNMFVEGEDEDEGGAVVRFKQRTIYDTRLSSVFGSRGDASPLCVEARLLRELQEGMGYATEKVGRQCVS